MARLSHFTLFRGEVYSLEDPDSPEAAICMSAFAASRSSDIYKMLVRKENAAEGMSENSDSRSGACARISALRIIVNLLFWTAIIPGRKHLHRTERLHVYVGKDPLGLSVHERVSTAHFKYHIRLQ